MLSDQRQFVRKILSRRAAENTEALDNIVVSVRKLTREELQAYEAELREKEKNAQRTAVRVLSFAIFEISTSIVESLLVGKLYPGRPRIIRPPGMTLDHIAQFVYQKKTYENTFKPTIDDHRIEHMEALQTGDYQKARWIAIRCNLLMVISMLAHAPYWVLKLCVDLLRRAVM